MKKVAALQKIRRCWRAYVLRSGHRGQLSARRLLRGQNPEGRQAGRSARRTADEVRAGDKPQDGESDRRYDFVGGARAGDQADQVRRDECRVTSERAMSESFVTTKGFMILRSPTEDGNADLRHAGMDCRHPNSQDAPETSMSGWIPALHAGMTQSKGCA